MLCAQGLYYIPDFITETEETAIAKFIDAMPPQRWVAAGERRMLNWGGRPGDLEIKEVGWEQLREPIRG